MSRRRLVIALWSAATTVLVAASPIGSLPVAQADEVRSLEYWLADYGFTDAWKTTRGAGVTVAVIDTGVDGSVPDLAGAVVGGTDLSGLGSADGQTPVGDESWHGTAVAELIAGRGTGGSNGVMGVAPEASILTVSVELGEGAVGSDGQIADAVRWAVDHGADVINLSLTRNSLDWPQSWDDAFSYAFDHDVVIVAAAGNRGTGTEEVGAPATIPGVVAVAGVDRDGTASQDASSQGTTIAVSAPSERLIAVDPDGSPRVWSGTSGAAPIVSGLAALVRSAHPELDADDVVNRLIATADPKGDPVPGPIYGYGLIDAAAAVTAAVPHVEANPLGSLSDWIATYRPASGASTLFDIVIPAPESTVEAAPRRPATAGSFDVYSFSLWAGPVALLIGLAASLVVLVVGLRARLRVLQRKE